MRNPADIAPITELLARAGFDRATIDEPTRRVSMRVPAGGDGLMTALQSVQRSGVELDDIALRQPNLDEVFLALTGEPA